MNKHDPIVGRYVYVTCQGKTYRTYYEENGEGIPMVCPVSYTHLTLPTTHCV